jgi:hypothetical protein
LGFADHFDILIPELMVAWVVEEEAHFDGRMEPVFLTCHRQQTKLACTLKMNTFGRRRKKLDDFFLTMGRDSSGMFGGGGIGISF